MAKPNYSMAKRQRDLAKKAKAEEKRLRKAQALEGDKVADETGAEEAEIDEAGTEEAGTDEAGAPAEV